MEWKKVMDTGDLTCDGFYGENGLAYERAVEVGPRTVVVLKGVKKPEPEKKLKSKGKKNGNVPLEGTGKADDKAEVSGSTVPENANAERRSSGNASVASL